MSSDDIVVRIMRAAQSCPCRRRPVIGSQIMGGCERCDLDQLAADEIVRLRAALVTIQSEAHTFGDGCDCGSVYVRRLDRVWDVAHKALTEEARRG